LQDNTTLDVRFSFIGQCLEEEDKNRISSRTLAMLLHGKNMMKYAETQFSIAKSASDRKARNTNGLTAIEVAAEGKEWDLVNWHLDKGFECDGVGKIVVEGDVYVGQIKRGKRHGHGKTTKSNGDVYVGKWRDDTPSDISLFSTILNKNIQQLSLNAQPDPRPPSTNSNHRESLQEKFFAYVEQGDVGQASQLFTDNKTYHKTYLENARNANGLTAIKVAVKKYQWDMLEWLLDNGFECWGVGKIEGREYGGHVYVGQVINGKRHGHGRRTWSDGSVYEGEWKNGRYHGHGKWTYPDGRVEEGRYNRGYFKG